MKNVKLTTVTLALLAGAIVASPAVNAEDEATVIPAAGSTVVATEVTQSKEVKEVSEEEVGEVEVVANRSAMAAKADVKDDAKALKADPTTPETGLAEAQVRIKIENALASKAITAEEARELQAELNAATGDQAAIDAVAAKVAAKEALIAEKRAAVVTINKLTISQNKKDAFISRIWKAANSAEIQTIVGEAQGVQSLKEYKKAANDKIMKLRADGIIEADVKQEALDAVEVATTKEGVDAAMVKVNAAEALHNNKKAYREEIVAMTDRGTITVADGNYIKDLIDNHSETEAKFALTKEKGAERIAFRAAHTKAIADLDAYLAARVINQNVYNSTKTELGQAPFTAAHVETVMAKLNNSIDIRDARKAAIEEIKAIKEEVNDVAVFSNTHVTIYTNKINAATTTDEIAKIVQEAKDFVVLKKAQIQAIKDVKELQSHGTFLTGLYGKEVTAFNTRINNAKTVKEVEAIVAEATALKDLRTGKKEAKDLVAKEFSLAHLSAEDVNYFNEQIEAAKTGKEATDLGQQAKGYGRAKTAATKELKGYKEESKITVAVHNDALNRIIEEAKSAEEVNAIMDEVRALINGETSVTSSTKPVEPTTTSSTKPVEPTTTTSTKDPSTTSTKDPSTTSTKPVKPTTSNTKTPVKPTTTKGKVVKKTDGKKLPQTNETVSGGVIAGGLLSMLAGAFLFFRKGK